MLEELIINQAKVMIIPAILTQDPSELIAKFKILNNLVKLVQVDIMDGKFVSNTSINLNDIPQKKFNFKLEAHLMVKNPLKYLNYCSQLKIESVIVHFEACNNLDLILKEMDKFKFQKGVAINPETPIELIFPYLKKIDKILIMGVHPGFSGQKFIPKTLNKIKKLRAFNRKIKIEVDGGVNSKNISKIQKSGANDFVVGSAIFKYNY